MLQEPGFRKGKCGLRGFADGGVVQGAVRGGDGGPDAEERGEEGALSEARVVVARGPEEVGVAEVEGGLLLLLLGLVLGRGRGGGAEDAAVGEQDVEQELGVEGPVAGVVEDEDGVDGQVLLFRRWRGAGGRVVDGQRQGPSVRGVVLRRGEGPEVRLRGDYVGGDDDATEPVRFGDFPAALPVAARHEDGFFRQRRAGGVGGGGGGG